MNINTTKVAASATKETADRKKKRFICITPGRNTN